MAEFQRSDINLSEEMQDKIPDKYICPISNRVMLNPVLEIKTGEIYDKNSIINQTDQSLDLHFYPLNDLKKAIHQYLKFNQEDNILGLHDAIQLEDQSDTEDGQSSRNGQKIGSVDIEKSRWLGAFLQYESIMRKTKQQNSITQEFVSELKEIDKNLNFSTAECVRMLEELVSVNKKFLNVRFQDASEEILEKRQSSIQTQKKLLELSEQCYQKSLKLLNKKEEYEESLQILKNAEEELQSARDELSDAHTDIDIKMSFEKEADFFSRQYSLPNIVQENELQSFFENRNEVSDVSDHFDSGHGCKEIKVQGQVSVKNFHATSAGNETNYLKIILQDSYSSITFEDSYFEKVGLWVGGLNKNQKCKSITFKNVNIRNAPEHGIYVQNSKKCVIISTKVDNSVLYGVVLANVNDFMLEKLDVQGCGGNGVYCYQNCKGEMKNCSITNCSQYGVCLSSGCVVNIQNVRFDNNKHGNLSGRYDYQSQVYKY